ncbi:MAG: S8 family serine peptidase [Acidobacteria bacterium]|nr:S8 family serine peptidase [Acidobacteriota bacterium]
MLVKLRRPLDEQTLREFQTQVEGFLGKSVVVKPVGGLDVVSVSAPGIDVNSFTRDGRFLSFEESFGADYVEPDFRLKLLSLPNDEFFRNQWGLYNSGQKLGACGGAQPEGPASGAAGADIGVAGAWAKTTGSANTLVATLDTGVDYSHPDLRDNIWRAPIDFDVTVGGQPVHCAANSYGFNVVKRSCDPADTDSGGHGTHVAGVIGAASDDSTGTVGVSQKVHVLAVNAFEDGGACVSQLADAIDLLIQLKRTPGLGADIRVVNNSYGYRATTDGNCHAAETCESRTLRAAVDRAGEAGMLFVAAAGNEGLNTDCDPEYPASFDLPNIISVAATRNEDKLADFSSFGPASVHVAAPGQDICSPATNGRYSYVSGTSFAAPFVSGTAALVLSRCDLTTDRLKAAILENADVIDLLAGKVAGGRRLNAGRAVSACGP